MSMKSAFMQGVVRLGLTLRLVLAGVFCFTCLGELEAQQKSSRPGYQILRQNEDWSAISESSPSDKSDFFDDGCPIVRRK